MSEIDFEKLNNIARSLNIEVIENPENSGLFYKDKKGNLVKFDIRAVAIMILDLASDIIDTLNLLVEHLKR